MDARPERRTLRTLPRRVSRGRGVAVGLAMTILVAACGSSGGEQSGTKSTIRPPVTSTDDRSTSQHGSSPAWTTTTPTTPVSSTSTISSTTTTTVSSTTTTTTSAPPATLPPDTTPAPTALEDLVAGSVGSRSQALQRALADQSYDPGPADGRFGLKTTQAVWAWQALHGLPRDGVVTPQVERMILARPAQAMLRPELGPTHSEVDLVRQVLLVFEDGKAELITHVSSGSGRHFCDRGHCGTAITPPGSFRYQRRIAGWRHARWACSTTRCTSTVASPCMALRLCPTTGRRMAASASRCTSPSTSPIWSPTENRSRCCSEPKQSDSTP